ncbi:MAG TPA: DUF1259 domain-containing protein [Pyrinomonadaceae bacterium]|nr:DUF1259 domain-containing protein [Pyrinomonadaceae bacterium]
MAGYISRRRALSGMLLTGASILALNTKGNATSQIENARLKKTPDLNPAEIAAIETAIGKKGRYIGAENLYTVPLPRNDLKVTIKGESVPISFGFGGWVSIKKTIDGKSAVLMSDTVLLPEEVNSLISTAQANGLEISAIHNHFFYEEPRIVYMHLHGMGDVAKLANSYAAAIKANKLFPANQPPASPPPTRTAKEIFDLPALDKIVGTSGAINGTTYKYTLGRSDQNITAMGAEITTNIGLNSWAAFTGSPESAHIAGDIAMLAHEVNSVIRALRSNDLEVVAVHHHMLDENPKIIFLHYYGRGEARHLAGGFRAAINELGKKGSAMKM